MLDAEQAWKEVFKLRDRVRKLERNHANLTLFYYLLLIMLILSYAKLFGSTFS